MFRENKLTSEHSKKELSTNQSAAEIKNPKRYRVKKSYIVVSKTQVDADGLPKDKTLRATFQNQQARNPLQRKQTMAAKARGSDKFLSYDDDDEPLRKRVSRGMSEKPQIKYNSLGLA